MKIQNIKSKQIEVPTSNKLIPDEMSNKIIEDPSLGTNAPSLSLKEQILTIQRAKAELEIESLAATMWGSGLLFDGSKSQRINAARQLGEKTFPGWEDFCTLNRALINERSHITWGNSSVTGTAIYSMLEIAKKLKPTEIDIEDFYAWIQGERSLGAVINDWFAFGIFCQERLSKSSINEAAMAIRIVFEKAGDRLSERKEAHLLGKMTNCVGSLHDKAVVEQGVIAAENTYKRGWRKDIKRTGLMIALKQLEDDSLRARVAWVISKADPKSILGVHLLGHSGSDGDYRTFGTEGEATHPLKLLLTDPSPDVREALASGIEDLCLAQKENGWYYESFSEKPELSPQNRIDCFTYILNILEQLNSSSYLQEYQARMLNRCCNVISYLVSDEAIAHIKSNGEKEEYEKLINRLSQLDLINFIKLVSSVESNDSAWRNVNVWNNASQTTDKILFSRAKTHDINHYFELQKEVSKIKKGAQSANVSSKMDSALGKINNAIELCLKEKPVQDVNWGTSLEFNIKINSLIELLERSQYSKLAILNLLEVQNRNGVNLSDLRNVSLDKALTDSNKAKLRQVLKATVYSRPVTQELFLKPAPSTYEGKALLLYRAYKSDLPPYKSFKDYYGMNDLKQYALKFAADVVISKKASRGLLLSGEPGTGKSMFASVLANELALPLIVVKSSEMGDSSKYLDDITKAGSCVVLVDEIERIAKPSNLDSGTINFLEALQKLPIVMIATTNSPATDTVEGMDINDDGTSAAIDKILVQNVHPDCLKILQPCYFFHRKSVGSDFAKQYLEQLIKTEKKPNVENLGLISTLGKGLTPFDIMTAINQEVGSGLEPAKIISTLGKLQLGRPRILTYAKEIKRIISIVGFEESLEIKGELDFKKLAFIAEDIPIDKIEELVRGCTDAIDQDSLLTLFCKHSGFDTGVLQVLKRV